MGRHCDVCNVFLSPALWPEHENGKKHKRMLHEWNRKKAVDCLVVSNLPPNMSNDELISRLRSYKGVVKVDVRRHEDNSAVLSFKNPMFAKKFTCTKRFLGFHELTITQPLISPPETQNDTVLEIDPLTRTQLLSKDNVESQMHFLVEHFSLKEETVRQRLGICQMLQAVMRDFFPNCAVIPYGSCANGLGMTDSDLDLFLDLKVDYEPVDENTQSRIISTLISHMDFYKYETRNFENVQFLQKVQSLNGRIVINIVKQILRKYAVECVELFCVPHARCPIVSFVHRPTRAPCDVSVQNGLAIHNTVLVRLFQQLDPRVRPLLFTIRYWAKRMQLVDSKKNRFSSYAITMLSVFYLQNCNPTVLPTVETLQQLTDSNAMCYGWKCHFCMEQEKIPKTANKDPLDILLAGFFEYYTEVDLASNVLCLRTGRVMSHPEFQEYVNCSSNVNDFKMSIFNIQDVFELNFNIARGVNAAGLEQWNSAVSQARSICSSGALWEKISSHNAWGLVCLCSLVPRPINCSKSRPTKKRKRMTEHVAQKRKEEGSKSMTERVAHKRKEEGSKSITERVAHKRKEEGSKSMTERVAHVKKQTKEKKKKKTASPGSTSGGTSTPFAKKRRTI